MNEVTTRTNTATRTAGPLRQSLLQDFTSYIDRSEKTTRTYLTNLRQMLAYLRYSGVSAPTRQDLIAWRDWMQKEHDAILYDQDAPKGWRYRTDQHGEPIRTTCSAATIRLYLQSARQFFAWTEAAGHYPNIAANIHTPKIRRDAHKKDALTAADVLRIENSIKEAAGAKRAEAAASKADTAGRIRRATEQGARLYALYLLAVTAGLRTVELSRANVKDLEYRGGRACIYIHGKGRAEADQKKPIAPQVYDAIREYLRIRSDRPTDSSPLFTATGNRSGGRRLAPTTISTMLKKAMQQAGYNSDRLTAHSLRHTAGSNVMELTGNLYLTQQYMRHDDPRTTEIYLHVNTEREQDDVARRLYEHYHAAGKESDARHKLQAIAASLDGEQLRRLTEAAQEIAK